MTPARRASRCNDVQRLLAGEAGQERVLLGRSFPGAAMRSREDEVKDSYLEVTRMQRVLTMSPVFALRFTSMNRPVSRASPASHWPIPIGLARKAGPGSGANLATRGQPRARGARAARSHRRRRSPPGEAEVVTYAEGQSLLAQARAKLRRLLPRETARKNSWLAEVRARRRHHPRARAFGGQLSASAARTPPSKRRPPCCSRRRRATAASPI